MQKAFVFVVVGAERMAKRFCVSLTHLRHYSRLPIILVTDLRRGRYQYPVDRIINYPIPKVYSDKQASRIIKTSLHKILDCSRWIYCYLDSDVLALSDKVDDIFEEWVPPITFASDHCKLKAFAGAAVNCSKECKSQKQQGLFFIKEAKRDFNVSIKDINWRHHNGGVFLFSKQSTAFMNTWHRLLMVALRNPQKWAVRDQGVLIATTWKHNLVNHKRLPIEYNYIVDYNNKHLKSYKNLSFTHLKNRTRYHPHFAHVYHNFGDKHWPVWNTIEQIGLSRKGRKLFKEILK